MKYENQFADVPSTDRARTTIEMPRKLEAQIKQYEPKTGVLQTTVSLLLTKLSHELTKSNIEPGDRAAYQHALASCILVLPSNYYPAIVGDPSADGERVAITITPTRPKRNRTRKAASGDDGQRASSVARETA